MKESLEVRSVGYASQIGRRIVSVILIPSWGRTFGAYDFAKDRVKEEGYYVGPMCCDEPIIFSSGILKWRNIGGLDYPLIDGFLLSDDFRGG